jgi:hypothetical protein
MRLTNTIRDAFVRAAMDDVPQVDYRGQIQTLVRDEAIALLPAKVRAVYNDKNLRHFIELRNVSIAGEWFPVPNGGDYRPSPAVKEKAEALAKLNDAQSTARSELRHKLHAVAYSMSTRKALVDALPEFEKYLPEDEAAACRTLPVVTNVVADFVKAGWPKGAAKPAAREKRK